VAVIVAVMWTAWVAPLLRFVLNSPLAYPRGLHFPGWLVLLLLVGSGGLVRILQDQRCGPWVTAGVGLAATLGAVAYVAGVDITRPYPDAQRLLTDMRSSGDAYPAALLALLATVLLWLWGSAASWDDYGETFGGFLIGTVVIGMLVLVTDADYWSATGQSLWGYALLFVVTALLSLGLVSARHTLAQARALDPQVPAPPRRWVAVVVLVVALVLIIGWPMAALVAPDAVREVSALIRPAWESVADVAIHVFLVFAYVIFLVLDPLIAVLQRVMAARWERMFGRLAEILGGLLGDPREVVGSVTAGAWTVDRGLLIGVRALVVMGLVVGILAAFYLAFRRQRRRGCPTVFEERASVLSSELLAAQWRSVMAGLGRRRRRRLYALVEGDDPRLVVRRLYQRFLAHTAVLGLARPRHITPRAYAQSLSEVLTPAGPWVEALTEAYQLARYGPVPPAPELVDTAREALDRLEAAWPASKVWASRRQA